MATVKAKPAAGSNPRRPVSPETKAKMSAARKGRPGRPRSPETRARIAAAKKGRRRGIPGSVAEGGGT